HPAAATEDRGGGERERPAREARDERGVYQQGRAHRRLPCPGRRGALSRLTNQSTQTANPHHRRRVRRRISIAKICRSRPTVCTIGSAHSASHASPALTDKSGTIVRNPG